MCPVQIRKPTQRSEEPTRNRKKARKIALASAQLSASPRCLLTCTAAPLRSAPPRRHTPQTPAASFRHRKARDRVGMRFSNQPLSYPVLSYITTPPHHRPAAKLGKGLRLGRALG
eukprot:748145-Hanusia_phi.AAC.2